MGIGEVEIDLSDMTQPENPDMEKYFEIAGKCENDNWHSAESFEFNITGPGEYDYNKKCPNCGKEINNRDHSTLRRMERTFGLGDKEKEHPVSQVFGGEKELLNYETKEIEDDEAITWVSKSWNRD